MRGIGGLELIQGPDISQTGYSPESNLHLPSSHSNSSFPVS
jgi:hypothetical protein